jgi:hypothetical protein
MTKRISRMALLVLSTTLIVVGGSVVGFFGEAGAAGTLQVSPNTGLTNGEMVIVSGSGFTASSVGAITECNNDPSQPTITDAGMQVPVSCSNPLAKLVETSSTGTLSATTFPVVEGTVGPPTTGTDSSGGSAATDAESYPCPPTQAQINAGVVCMLTYGDDSGDTASHTITFAGQALPQPTVNLISSLNPAETDSTVSYTATLSPGPDGGTVNFKSSSRSINGCSKVKVKITGNQAKCTVMYSTAGTYQIQATYSGDGTFASSKSTVLRERVRN